MKVVNGSTSVISYADVKDFVDDLEQENNAEGIIIMAFHEMEKSEMDIETAEDMAGNGYDPTDDSWVPVDARVYVDNMDDRGLTVLLSSIEKGFGYENVRSALDQLYPADAKNYCPADPPAPKTIYCV